MTTVAIDPVSESAIKPPLLKVRNLKTYLHLQRGVVRAVDGVDLEVGEGETLGVVGESGSGKTMTSLSMLRLLPKPGGRIVSGSIELDGTDLVKLGDAEMARDWRGRRISMVSQDPLTSLNPVFTVGDRGDPSRHARGESVQGDHERGSRPLRACRLARGRWRHWTWLPVPGIPRPARAEHGRRRRRCGFSAVMSIFLWWWC
jgi:ABC-type glutathione transport system ATPase component